MSTATRQHYQETKRETTSGGKRTGRPDVEESAFFTEADFEMNEDPEGFFSNGSSMKE